MLPAALWATTTASAFSDCAISTRSRYEQAVVPPSTTAIQFESGRETG